MTLQALSGHRRAQGAHHAESKPLAPVPARDPARPGARLALAGTLAVALIVVALHAIKPEFEPSWRFVSEYAIGRQGWIMKLAFLIWAASCAALAFALSRETLPRRGRIGIALLWLVAVALVFAGVFPQDPVTAGPDEATTSGTIHALASMIGIPGIPVAALLISSGLRNAHPPGAPRPVPLTWTTHATWISLAAMAGYLMWAVPRAGGFNADVWAGWMNRLVVATYLAWQLTLASTLLANRRAGPPGG
jgi:hypothetical protein